MPHNQHNGLITHYNQDAIAHTTTALSYPADSLQTVCDLAHGQYVKKSSIE